MPQNAASKKWEEHQRTSILQTAQWDVTPRNLQRTDKCEISIKDYESINKWGRIQNIPECFWKVSPPKCCKLLQHAANTMQIVKNNSTQPEELQFTYCKQFLTFFSPFLFVRAFGSTSDSVYRWYERTNAKCTCEEWSASTSHAPLLVHQSGHVSQFFEEGMFDMAAAGPTPRQLSKYTESATSLCDWGVIDKMTNKVVMISRIYHRFTQQFCGQNVMFLGISMPWGGKSIRPDC